MVKRGKESFGMALAYYEEQNAKKPINIKLRRVRRWREHKERNP